MVVWNAGVKDCRDPVTGETVECVICFEEFEIGCEIARLECLCRYHKVHYSTKRGGRELTGIEMYPRLVRQERQWRVSHARHTRIGSNKSVRAILGYSPFVYTATRRGGVVK